MKHKIFTTFVVLTILFLLSSCHKYGEGRATSLKAGIIYDPQKAYGDTLYHKDILFINLHLEQIIPFNSTDETFVFPVGRIQAINVIANYILKDTIIKDTINDRLRFEIIHPQKVINQYKNIGESSKGLLKDIGKIKPYTSDRINLYFIIPPDTMKKQYFTVEYVETDNYTLTDTTQTFYIK